MVKRTKLKRIITRAVNRITTKKIKLACCLYSTQDKLSTPSQPSATQSHIPLDTHHRLLWYSLYKAHRIEGHLHQGSLLCASWRLSHSISFRFQSHQLPRALNGDSGRRVFHPCYVTIVAFMHVLLVALFFFLRILACRKIVEWRGSQMERFSINREKRGGKALPFDLSHAAGLEATM